MPTCMIITEFLGISLGECGDPATRALSGHCERGHTRNRPVCEMHAEGMAKLPDAVFCEQCSGEGHETPMTLEWQPAGGR